MYHGFRLDEGRLLHLGGERYEVRGTEFSPADIDSLFVELAGGTGWKPIVAGAGIGAMVGLFTGAIWQSLNDEKPERGRWFVGGAIAGGLAGVAVHTTRSGRWQKRWPTPGGS